MCPVCQDGARSTLENMKAEHSRLAVIVFEQQLKMDKLEKAFSEMSAIVSAPIDTRSGKNGEGLIPNGGVIVDRLADGGFENGIMAVGGQADGGVASSGVASDGVWRTQHRHKAGRRTDSTVPTQYISASASSVVNNNMESLIEKTVKTLNRKKANVVVSGLLEQNSETEDKALFVELSERFLHMKPIVIGCKRLGRSYNINAESSSQQPVSNSRRQRLLLVTLSSEIQASDILRKAKLLRESANEDVRNFVYINKDMTKEEARTAYDRRVARRTGPNLEAGGQSGSILSASAPPFVPPVMLSSQLDSLVTDYSDMDTVVDLSLAAASSSVSTTQSTAA